MEKRSLNKFIASFLCANMFVLNMPVISIASEISGITPTGNTYNIEATKVSGSTGFRHYDKFNLTEGDIANLIYKNNYSKFVNLVNNQVNINGIVNTMKNNAFYNGHAIFVSPNGIVIGASGVLNVGSLSLLTPSQSKFNDFISAYNLDGLSSYEFGANKYNALITDSAGNIVVNGKILSRDEVNLYGKNITVEGSQANKAGIIAASNIQNTHIGSSSQANTLFDSLVSNNIKNANQFSLTNGKINLVAKANQDMADDDGIASANIKISNSDIAANDVNMSAKTTMDTVYYDIGKAKVDVENSNISADNVSLKAETTANTASNINFTPPVVWAWLFENATYDEDGNIIKIPSLSDYFSASKPYTYFDGTRSFSEVNVKNSIINATNNIDINTKAIAKMNANSNILSAELYPQLFYAFGTQTDSKVNIENSTLNAGQNINLDAFSLNNLTMDYLNDNMMIRLTPQDAYNFAVFHNSTIADTQINIKNSNLAANTINSTALADVTDSTYIYSTVTIGKNVFASEDKGASGATFILQFINKDVNTGINVEGSTLTSVSGTNMKAQNINLNDNYLWVNTIPAGYVSPDKIYDTSTWSGWIKNGFQKIGNWSKEHFGKYFTKYNSVRTVNYVQVYKNLFGSSENLVENNVNQAAGQNFEKAMFQAAGGIMFNTQNNNNNIIVDASTIKSNNLDLNAITYDAYANRVNVSAASSDAESAIIGAGIGVDINKQTNNTNVIVQNSSSIIADTINMSAINEIPGNEGTLGISNRWFTLGIALGSNADDIWNVDLHDFNEPESSIMVPQVGLFGLFNNFVGAATTGDKAAISASFLYNSTNNNATATVKDSIISASNSFDINAVNSVVTRDTAGFLGISSIFTISNLLSPYKTNGTGGSVLIQNLNNDATAQIIGSEVSVNNGDLNVNAASEQSYLNIGVMNAKANQLGINGSVNVQKITGDTTSQIIADDTDEDNITASTVSANNININAGKANVAFVKKSEPQTEEEKEQYTVPTPIYNDNYVLQYMDRRDVHDDMTVVSAIGMLTMQSQEKSDPMSASLAFGAAVNAQDIDRNINSIVKDSILNATSDINVLSNSNTKAIAIALGGAFAGSQSPNIGGGGAENLQNIGGAQNIIANAQADNDNGNVIENVAEGQDENVQNGVNGAGNASTTTYSIAVAGSVNAIIDNTKSKSEILNSTLNVGKDLNVSTIQDNMAVMGAGGIAKSGKIGAGAGINIYSQKGAIKSGIKNSTVNYTSGVTSSANIIASAENKIYNLAAGVGAANDQSSGVNAAVGGTFVKNATNSEIEAKIENSTINADKDKTTVNVNASEDVDILDAAGGISAVSAGTNLALGSAIASSANSAKSSIVSTVKDSQINNAKSLDVISSARNDCITVGVAGALVTSAQTSFNFNGTVDVDYFDNDIKSQIINSTISVSDDVNLSVSANNTSKMYGGVLNFSGSQKGVGVNGTVVVDVYNNNVNASIDSGSKVKAKNIAVDSNVTDYSNIIPISMGIATQTSMAAGTVNVNNVKNKVKSSVSGDISTSENLSVNAFDETTIYTRGGTLELAGQEATAVIGGALNYDAITKSVVAEIGNDTEKTKIESGGTVDVRADSINSLGGTKNSQGEYDRDDITSDTYNDTLMVKNDKGEYSDINMSNSFENWNMFYNISAGAKGAINGAIIVKLIENDTQAQIINSELSSNKVNVVADDYSVKNIIAGQISATNKIAVGLQWLNTTDKSNVSAIIGNDSNLTVSDTTSVTATNDKDNNQILIAGTYSADKFSGVANIAVNDISDVTKANIDSSVINSQKLNINALEDMNASHILVSGAVAAGEGTAVAVSLSPVINTYGAETYAGILNGSTVENAIISMTSDNNIKTRDISVGFSGTSQGVGGIGIAIWNKYDNKVKSYIDSSTISDAGNINLDSNALIKSNNWIISGAFSTQGLSLVVNAIVNNINSETESSITNSHVQSANDIVLSTNKNTTDKILNVAGSASIAGEGVSAETNTTYNYAKGKSTAAIVNTEIENSNSITLNANNSKDYNNVNIGIGFTGIGADLQANVIVNKLNDTTIAQLDAGSTKVNSSGTIAIDADETSLVRNTLGIVSVAGEGAPVTINANVNTFNSLVSSAILSAINGQIAADYINVNSEMNIGLSNTNVGIAVGAGSAAGLVVLNNIGDNFNISNDELTSAGVFKVIDEAEKDYKSVTDTNIGIIGTVENQTGNISDVNANITAKNDININSESIVKGADGDKFSMTNVKVDAALGGIGASVVVNNVKEKTTSAISGGRVISDEGDINISSRAKIASDINLVGVTVAAGMISGNFGYYTNETETTSAIKNAVVSATNVNINADTDLTSDVTVAAVLVDGASYNMIISQNENASKTTAAITGDNVDITANKLNIISSLTKSNVSSMITNVDVSLASMVNIVRNYANLSNVSQAIIDASSGTINVGEQLNIASVIPNGITADAQLRNIGISGVSFANPVKTQAKIDTALISGIGKLTENNGEYSNSAAGIKIKNSGATNIYSGIENLNNITAKAIDANSRLYNFSISAFQTDTFTDYAINNMSNYTMLSAIDHEANVLNIGSYASKTTVSRPTETDAPVLFDFGSVDAQSKITGKNEINISGKNKIATDTNINLNDNSTASAHYKGVKVSLLSGVTNGFETTVNNDNKINLAGDYLANSTTINSSVRRETNTNYRFTNVSIIGEGSRVKAYNQTQGNTIINIDSLNSVKDAVLQNTLSVNAQSKNYNIVNIGTTGALGLLFTGNGTKSESVFDTSNTININNSNINANGNLTLLSDNYNELKSYITDNQGFGAVVWDNLSANNIYNSSAGINFKDSSIKANNININSTSFVGMPKDKTMEYKNDAGFAVLVDGGTAKANNTLEQTSTIDFDNTTLNATNNLALSTNTNSLFKQEIETSARSVVISVARNSGKVEVNNTNTIDIDSNSKLTGTNNTIIDMNSNNDLWLHTTSNAKDLGGNANSNGYVRLNVTNELSNNGSINAGNLVDIGFNRNSENSLYQHSTAYSYGAVPTGGAGGGVYYTNKNKLNIPENADITSGKNVSIEYSEGSNYEKSDIYYERKWLWFIPDSNKRSKVENSIQNSMLLAGKIKAGQGNQRYLKIDRNGDAKGSIGFYDNDYKVEETAHYSGEEIKQQELNKLNNKKNELEIQYNKDANKITEYQNQQDENQSEITIISNGIAGYEDCVNKSEVEIMRELVPEDTVSVDKYNEIMENASSSQAFSFEEYIQSTDLSDEQKTSMINAYNTVHNNITEKTIDTSRNFYVYYNDNSTPDNPDDDVTYIVGNNNPITEYKSEISELTDKNTKLDEQISVLNTEKSNLQSKIFDYINQIAIVEQTTYEDVDILSPSYNFNDMEAYADTSIIVKGIKNTNITGNGNFVGANSGLLVDNYSNYDLIFNGINMEGASTSLSIDNLDYTQFLNNEKVVNSDKKNAIDDVTETAGVHFISEDNKVNDKTVIGITINNYYDTLNPTVSDDITSDITFNNHVITSKDYKVWNESGNILVNNPYISGKTDLAATQGNVVVNKKNADYTIKAGDRIFGGDSVEITANNIINNGIIATGYADRNLTITSEMLENLIADPTTGEVNMINLAETDYSPYLSENNNIKALYKDGKIVLFNINKEYDGNLTFNIVNDGTVSGGGTIKHTSGFAHINIDNQTDKPILVSNIINNKITGVVSSVIPSEILTEQGYEDANILITSNGTVDIANQIINGYLKNETEEYIPQNNGKVKIESLTENGGINVAKISDETEIQNTLYSSGGIELNVGSDSEASKELNIQGNIYNSTGDIIVKNNGTGTTISGNIKNKGNDSNIEITNSNTGKLSISGNITDEKGNVSVTNSGAGGSEISGAILAKEGDTTVSNTSGGLSIAGNITDKNGKIDIINSGAGGTAISGTILDESEKITIYNANGNLNIKGYVVDRKGDIGITNTSYGDINISGTVLANEGNITVYSTNGGTNASGYITNDKGNVSIINNGSKGIDVSGTVLAKDGILTVYNTKGGMNVVGNMVDNKGDLKIINNGADGINISGLVNAKDGILTVYNTQGGMNVIGNMVDNKGDLKIINNGADGINVSGVVTAKEGDITVVNHAGNVTVAKTGKITNDNGNINISNNSDKGINLLGLISDNKGNVDITNINDGINIGLSGYVSDKNGTMNITNSGSNGINIVGYIRGNNSNLNIDNKNSDITIGEYDSNNDKYIDVNRGNVTVSQINGNILNGIIDPDTSAKHQNVDFANPEHAYKTLISTTGENSNLVMNITDGDIGSYSNLDISTGKSVDANTRDYTDSINVNISGNVSAKVTNSDKTDARFVNLRAKESDLNVKSIDVDGNIMLTSADWRQADTRPTPDDDTYYTGYSIFAASNDDVNLKGQNISIIASNNIGVENKKLKYMQDTLKAPNSSVSFEAENDLMISGKATGEELKIYQILTKRGSIDFDMATNADIKEITAGKGLRLTQKAQNLTIRNLGLPVSPEGETVQFADILNPHDDLVYGPSPVSPEKTVIPNYVIIRVLDAIDTPERSDSNLTVYSLDVRGNHGQNEQYYADGSKLADVTLMADNIFAESYIAPDSNVPTKDYPHGVKLSGGTYTNTDYDPDDTNVYEKRGINAYGEGAALTIDVLGVDADLVEELIGEEAKRDKYIVQKSITNISDIFKNKYDRTKNFGYDFKAKDVFISANDYVDTNRGVVVDTVYAKNAYINTHDTNLEVQDGYINNYAEFRNSNKIAVVDNDFRRIVNPADIQLYTQKTGSFNLDLDRTINMKTSAPTVYNNPHMLVNGYHSEWNFVNKGQKESKDLYENKKMTENLDKNNYNEPQKRISERFDTTTDKGLSSNFEIFDISTTGACVKNDKKLKRGKNTTITLKFDDVVVTVNAKVVKIEGNKAGLEFVDMPKDVANKILYRYMQRPNSIKSNLSMTL